MLGSGVSINRTADHFGIPRSTFALHVRSHRKKVEEPSTLLGGVDLADVDPSTLGEAGRRLYALAIDAYALMEDAKKVSSPKDRAACMNAARQTIQALGQLTGELSPNAEKKLLETIQWRAATKALMDALRPFPEARAAVIAAFRGLPSTIPEPFTSPEPEDDEAHP